MGAPGHFQGMGTDRGSYGCVEWFSYEQHEKANRDPLPATLTPTESIHRVRPSNPLTHHALAVVMAGGNGTRLGALTRWHAKPTLPFGGHYRNIDFTLSNCLNSGIRRIGLLTQYRAHSLIRYVHQGWNFFNPAIGEFIEFWPPEQRSGAGWYAGTADAVYQNMDTIRKHEPAHVVILAADHIYKMDYAQMLAAHIDSGADATVGCLEMPLREAAGFGVLEPDIRGRVRQFTEKPAQPAPIPGNEKAALVSMGIYVFNRDFLYQCLVDDAGSGASRHDFGYDILPCAARTAEVSTFRFRGRHENEIPYWRDIGTLDHYWQANMDLLGAPPELELRDKRWPIWTHQVQCAPTQFVGNGQAADSVVAAGCLVGGRVRRSVLFTNAQIGAGSAVEDTLVLPNARIGRNCRLRRAIIDSGCVIPDGTVIGDDLLDAAADYYMSPNGIVLVTSEAGQRAGQERERQEVA